MQAMGATEPGPQLLGLEDALDVAQSTVPSIIIPRLPELSLRGVQLHRPVAMEWDILGSTAGGIETSYQVAE